MTHDREETTRHFTSPAPFTALSLPLAASNVLSCCCRGGVSLLCKLHVLTESQGSCAAAAQGTAHLFWDTPCSCPLAS